MIIKKKFLLLIISLIIILQTLLVSNNNQKTTFRYFKWTLKEISIGKLISISFFSGFLISTLLSNTIISPKKNNSENIKNNNEFIDDDEDINPNVEMPPQRDIRSPQPTISVNYRVVKNTEENNFKNDQNYSDRFINKDDWDNGDDDW